MNGFDFTGAPVPVRIDLAAGLARVWDVMAAPGASWTGEERVAIAAAAREAFDGEDADPGILPPIAVRAAGRLHSDPASIGAATVDQFRNEGLDDARYVELIGVVARLAAADGVMRALGLPPAPLPTASEGSPTGEINHTARRGPAHVPMVGGASIPQALSLVPAESAAQEELHGPLYMTYEGMADLAFTRGLDRTRMELVAARTSAINECFY